MIWARHWFNCLFRPIIHKTMLKPQTDGHTSVYARTPAIGKCQGLFARLRFPYSECSYIGGSPYPSALWSLNGWVPFSSMVASLYLLPTATARAPLHPPAWGTSTGYDERGAKAWNSMASNLLPQFVVSVISTLSLFPPWIFSLGSHERSVTLAITPLQLD